MHKIDFKVPLSGSKLFDIHTMAVAKNLCDKFIGLDYKMEDTCVHIFGELNDYWFDKWNMALFQIGEIDPS